MKTLNESIQELAGLHYPAQIARILGITVNQVYSRLKSMNVKALTFSEVTAPTHGEWIGAAMWAAATYGVNYRHIISGYGPRGVALARWRAFEKVLADRPDYSVAGLARTSGFHHSSILHGLARLAGRERGKNATGRMPVYAVEKRAA